MGNLLPVCIQRNNSCETTGDLFGIEAKNKKNIVVKFYLTDTYRKKRKRRKKKYRRLTDQA
ncbi:MAG: hypothetical protein CMO44_17970 [Verrucomicrobiales bacterium]|nr:hypothetical protein [Verrucomicrobiales bacterium]